MDAQKWDKVFAVNVKGAMFCYKHAAIQMIKQGRGGRIIGAASVASKQGALCVRAFTILCQLIFHVCEGNSNISCYAASKFALRGLTQSAGEYGYKCKQEQSQLGK